MANFIRTIFVSVLVLALPNQAAWSEEWVQETMAFLETIEIDPSADPAAEWRTNEEGLESLSPKERLLGLEAIAFTHIIDFRFEDYRRVRAKWDVLAAELRNQQSLNFAAVFDVLENVNNGESLANAATALSEISLQEDLRLAQKIRTLLALGYVHSDLQNASEAMRAFNRAKILSRDGRGDHVLSAELDFAEYYILADAGDYAGGARALLRWYESSQASGRPFDSIAYLGYFQRLFTDTENFNEAIFLNKTIMRSFDQKSVSVETFFNYKDCGLLYRKVEQFEKSAECYEKAGTLVDLVPERKNEWLSAISYSSVMAGRTERARHFFDQLMADPVVENKSERLRLEIAEIEARLLYAEGDTDGAYQILISQRESDLRTATLRTEAIANQLRALVNEEAEHLRKRTELSEGIAARQRWISGLIAFIALGTLGIAVFLWRNRNKLKAAALQYQNLFTEAESLADELKIKSEQNKKLATRDPLTGLLNRRGFFAEFQALLESGSVGHETIALGLLDLDSFKPVNDVYGHQVGDEMLKTVAKRLTETLGAETVIGRLGGDEFAFAFKTSSGADGAMMIGQAAREVLRQPAKFGDARLAPQGSIGIVMSEDQSASCDVLYRNGDFALYEAKAKGDSSVVFFNTAMKAKLDREGALERAMTAAKAEDFFMVYQPIFDLVSQRTTGFEALARWVEPEHGEIPPSEFIPLAERNGKIAKLSRIFLSQALQDAETWSAGLNLSINLSANDLGSIDQANMLKAIIEASDFPAERLIVEITETAIIRDAKLAAAALEIIRSTGAKIAMDDFGTGNASLIHLQEFPIDRLKIDMALTSAIEVDDATRDIVQFVIKLCDQLKIDCVVEGVASQEQMLMIQRMSAKLMQGFHHARPMLPDEIKRFLERETNGLLQVASSRRANRTSANKQVLPSRLPQTLAKSVS